MDDPLGGQARWPTLRRDGPTSWLLNLMKSDAEAEGGPPREREEEGVAASRHL